MTSWTFGGTALTTFGKVTLINDYLDIAERRGDNQIIPYKHGRVFVEKFFDERTLTFGIAVTAANALALEALFDTIRAKLSPRTQQVLAMTMEDATVRNVNATVNSQMDIERVTNSFARVTIEFSLADPLWRLSTAIADNTLTINASPKAMTVTNPGNVEERDPTITIDGPFSSITIANSTTGASVTYTGAIGAAETVTIGTNSSGEYYATLSTGSANVIGNVTHSGSAALMTFAAGANTLAITSAGGNNTGTVKISFYAPFL